MSDRYSYICRVCFKNGDEYDECFDSEEEATEYAENYGGDLESVEGYQILRMDWYYHSECEIAYIEQ